MKKILIQLTFMVPFTFSSQIWAQDVGEQRTQLERQIEALTTKIQEQERQESSAVALLNDLEQEINLSRSLIKELQKDEQKKRQNIETSERSLKQTESELKIIRQLYAKRLVYFYKHGRARDLELLLSAKSLNQVYLWLKYQKVLAENDLRNIQNIQTKEKVITAQKDRLRQAWQATQEVLDTKNKQAEKMKVRQEQRQKLLKDIRKNIKQYQQEVEASLAQIKKIIEAQELERQQQQQQQGTLQALPQYSKFPDLKKKMIWPVRGEVIKKFGNYRHPELKTITNSLGIDIKAPFGAPVNPVADGIVSQIQWMRGIGTLILLNHYGGYYTVYANVGDILIKKDDSVQMGQPLGTVGDTGIEKVPQLHFEIWEKNNAEDPLKWLGK